MGNCEGLCVLGCVCAGVHTWGYSVGVRVHARYHVLSGFHFVLRVPACVACAEGVSLVPSQCSQATARPEPAQRGASRQMPSSMSTLLCKAACLDPIAVIYIPHNSFWSGLSNLLHSCALCALIIQENALFAVVALSGNVLSAFLLPLHVPSSAERGPGACL